MYYGIIITGFTVTLSVTLMYGCLAPWYKSDTGKSFFTLLSALTLILSNSMLRIVFGRQEWTTSVGMILFTLYILAMGFIGWHVYQAQVARYRKNKKVKL
jgi:hypothetical protein